MSIPTASGFPTTQEMPTIPTQKSQPKPHACLELAQRIKDGKAGGEFLYCLEDNKFYHYKQGWWESLFDIEFIGKMQENLPELSASPMSKKKEVAENFKCIARKRIDQFNTTTLINLRNGMLCPITKELREHNSKYYSTNQLPYKYDPTAKCELWIKSLNEIFEDDTEKLSVLQEFIGYCLTRDTRKNKALLLLGQSDCGKSTILETIKNLIGEHNCSSVKLKNLNNHQYTAALINKLVNFDTDVSNKATEYEAEFRTITRGEPISAKVLYSNPFDFVPFCKLVLAANDFPRITDHTSAFYNRLILIPCNRIFTEPEQNKQLPIQLIEELPGILNWALEGLKRLNDRTMFNKAEFMKEAIEELEDENNPVNLFFKEHIVIESGAILEKGELYDRFKEWAEKNNNYKLSASRFASCVFKKFHKQTNKDLRAPNNGKRIWRNIKYIYEKQDGQQTVDWNE